MSKDERKEQIESMAEKFVELDAEHKATHAPHAPILSPCSRLPPSLLFS